jgi:serine/threonine-protein kinase
MLIGRPPFQGSSPMDTLLAVLESDPPVPRSIDRRVDRDLELITLKSLQKPVDLRYASAGDLAAGDLRVLTPEALAQIL